MQTYVMNFLHEYGPWILFCLVPSIITGLTAAPKDAKVLDYIKLILQYLSVATHKDQPGTFKVPFVAKMALPNGVPETKEGE